MQNQQFSRDSDEFTRNAVEAALKVGIVFLLLIWCFYIAKPFINPLVWGVIIAVALYPLHRLLTEALRGRQQWSAGLITVCLLLIILGPLGFLGNVLADNLRALTEQLQNEKLLLPPPNEKIMTWPLIGPSIYEAWELAANNLSGVLKTYAPQLKQASKWLFVSSASVVLAVLELAGSVIICGMLLVNGAGGHELALKIARRLAGDKGDELADLCVATIRGVARGVLGVALIQSLLAGVGFFMVGIPAAGLLTLICLFIAVVQLPTFILVLPSILYVFSNYDSLTATIFMVWMLGVGLIDNILKPLLMGHGLALPMAVVFIGAIGGMIFSGIIGLFVGAVLLALGYKLFLSWLNQQPSNL